MNATNEELKAMYLGSTTAELYADLASCEDTIREMRSYGKAWALDSRQMRVAEHNSSYIRAEIRRRETGTNEIQPSQVGPVIERKAKGW